MTKKIFFSLTIILLFSLNLISAINLQINAKPVFNTAIVDLDKPAVFDITITNLADTDTFEIYSMVGIDILPKEKFIIKKGETRTINAELFPQYSLASREGFITFEYNIKNSKNEIQKEKLAINIIHLKNLFLVNVEDITPESKVMRIILKNNAMQNLDDIKIKLTSAFFSYSENFSFKSLESKEIGVPIDREKIKGLSAGNYLMDIKTDFEGQSAINEIKLKFLEQENIQTTETKILLGKTDWS